VCEGGRVVGVVLQCMFGGGGMFALCCSVCVWRGKVVGVVLQCVCVCRGVKVVGVVLQCVCGRGRVVRVVLQYVCGGGGLLVLCCSVRVEV